MPCSLLLIFFVFFFENKDFNTLKEIADWIGTGATNTTATQLVTDVDNLKSITKGYEGEGSIKTEVNGIDTRLGTVEADYLKAADKTELNNAITAETSAREAAVAGVQGQIDKLNETYATDEELADAVADLESQITAAQNAATTADI